MKHRNRNFVRKICRLAGVCLLVAATVVLIAWQWNVHRSAQRAENYVRTLRALIPEPQGAAPEERRENAMSVLAVDGIDFVGILELPRCAAALPVGADWGESSNYPCRFHGSVYDRTVQIGTTTQKGQFDFYREISVGDPVYFTDMEGNRYTYQVKDLRYEKHADQAALRREDAALTIFIKNEFAFEYIMVFCDV